MCFRILHFSLNFRSNSSLNIAAQRKRLAVQRFSRPPSEPFRHVARAHRQRPFTSLLRPAPWLPVPSLVFPCLQPWKTPPLTLPHLGTRRRRPVSSLPVAITEPHR